MGHGPRIAPRYAAFDMRVSQLVVSTLACLALVLLAAWLFHMPLTRAFVLAPIIVASVGATLALVVLWTKIAVESLRGQRHPGRLVAGGLAVFALLVALSFFVDLPARH